MTGITLLALFLALGAPAPDARPINDWPLFSAPDGSFSVRMPDVPQISGLPSSTTYLVRLGDSTYYVQSSELPDLLQALPSQQLLEVLRDGAVESLGEFGGSRLVRSEPSTAFGFPCITYLAEATPKGFPRTRVLTRLIHLGARTIAIVHSAPTKDFQEARVDEFVATFKLLEAKAP